MRRPTPPQPPPDRKRCPAPTTAAHFDDSSNAADYTTDRGLWQQQHTAVVHSDDAWFDQHPHKLYRVRRILPVDHCPDWTGFDIGDVIVVYPVPGLRGYGAYSYRLFRVIEGGRSEERRS